LRRLRVGEDVYDRQGDRLGTLERLVVDEAAHTVSHLVVGGHIVGVSHFADSTEDELICDLDRHGLQAMPDVHHPSVGDVPAHWEAPRGYALDNFLRIAGALIGQGPYTPPAVIEPDLASIHEITEGSPVWHGDEQLGEVSTVLTDDDGRVTDLVVQRGAFGEARTVPSSHVTEVIGNNIHLDLSPSQLESLPTHEEDPAQP
jgi:PRC-barrel domain